MSTASWPAVSAFVSRRRIQLHEEGQRWGTGSGALGRGQMDFNALGSLLHWYLRPRVVGAVPDDLV